MNVCPMCRYEEREPWLAPDRITGFVCTACELEITHDIITI